MKKVIVALLLMFAGLSSNSAYAFDWSILGAKVTHIEVSYVPDVLLFQVDQTVGNCPAGANLSWTIRGNDPPSRIANVQAVLTTLLTASVSGKTLALFGTNSTATSGCSVEFMHFREGVRAVHNNLGVK